MSAKRTVATVKQFDYTSREAYEKDIPKMKAKGYVPTEGLGWGEMLKGGKIVGSEDSEWKYSAFFVKSDMM
jgi:hypothetical protein